MMIAICAAMLAGVLGSVGRYLQGNGHAGPGRWMVWAICLMGTWYGLGNQLTTIDLPIIAGVIWAAALAGWTTGGGYTRWEDIPYSLARYGLPPLLAVAPWVAATDVDLGVLAYPILCGVGIALNQYFLAQHKPQWLINLVGNRDVATIPAGFMVAAPLPLM